MSERKEKNLKMEILKAIRCCREDLCDMCPMREKICDEMRVEMESLPAELVDMIEEELEGNKG